MPLVEGRGRDEMRVLKLALRDQGAMPRLAEALVAQAKRCGALRVAIRIQGEYGSAFRALVARGARVRWTDLRMTLTGFEEAPPTSGLLLSNWEI